MISPRLNKLLLAAPGITVMFIGFSIATTYTPVETPSSLGLPPDFAGMPCHFVYETDHEMFPSDIVVAEGYMGTFVWDGGSRPQDLELRAVETQTINSNSGIVRVISGRGTYRTPDVTEIDFQINIQSDGRVEMIESNPSTINFVVDGRHVGQVQADGAIRARWQDDRYPGRSGTLILHPIHDPFWSLEDSIIF